MSRNKQETLNSARKARLSDGIVRQNPVLMSGLFAGPVIGAATGAAQAAAVCFVFTLVTFITVTACRFLPKNIAFAIRIVVYALAASAVYFPVILLAGLIFDGELLDSISLYLMIIVVNPLILTKTESRFFLRPIKQMIKDLVGFILGFDLSCLLVGCIRDILTDNMIGSRIVSLPFQLPIMGTVAGGFILTGVLAGTAKALYNYRAKRKKSKKQTLSHNK